MNKIVNSNIDTIAIDIPVPVCISSFVFAKSNIKYK